MFHVDKVENVLRYAYSSISRFMVKYFYMFALFIACRLFTHVIINLPRQLCRLYLFSQVCHHVVSMCIVLGERTNDLFCPEVVCISDVELVINWRTQVLILRLTLET
jgi:hypothetical protein